MTTITNESNVFIYFLTVIKSFNNSHRKGKARGKKKLNREIRQRFENNTLMSNKE